MIKLTSDNAFYVLNIYYMVFIKQEMLNSELQIIRQLRRNVDLCFETSVRAAPYNEAPSGITIGCVSAVWGGEEN